jgi:hypothetical protein
LRLTNVSLRLTFLSLKLTFLSLKGGTAKVALHPASHHTHITPSASHRGILMQRYMAIPHCKTYRGIQHSVCHRIRWWVGCAAQCAGTLTLLLDNESRMRSKSAKFVLQVR